MKKYIGEIGLFLTAIVWGMGFVGTKLSLDGGLTPLQLITIRFLIASIFINLIFYKRIKENISKEAIKCGAILGAFLFININYIKNVVPGPIGNPNNAQIIANAVHPNKNAIDIGIIVDIKLPTPNSFLYF